MSDPQILPDEDGESVVTPHIFGLTFTATAVVTPGTTDEGEAP